MTLRAPLAPLPHEYPFRLADRVVTRDGRGEGTVRAAIAADAWAGRAYPALLLGELIAQSALLLEGGDAALGRSGFLAGLSDVVVERAPEPGDLLDVRVRVLAHFGAITRFSGEVRDQAGALIGRADVTVKNGEAPAGP